MSTAKYIFTIAVLISVAAVRAAGIGDYYSIENIAAPKGLDQQVGGLDFMPDGRLVACFHRGEVYTYHPETKKWTLFADGLQEPLGIRATSDREVVVMQRPHSQWATQGEEVDQRLTAFQRDIVHVCLHLVTDQLRPAQIVQIIACDDRPE